MNEYLKYAVSCFVLMLIWACIARQKRYCREVITNAPTGSMKAGYKISFFSMSFSLAIASYYNTPEMWDIFVSVVTLGFLFCLKITFSPAVIAFTLAVCTVKLNIDESFPFLEVWNGFIRVLTWRLPDGIRACYSYLSFLWVLIVLFKPSNIAATNANPLESSIDVLGIEGGI
jgi:hypothetical protein